MEKLFSKISLYDLLTTVVIGYILCIAMKHSNCCIAETISTPFTTIATTMPRKIVLAFIIGLIFHKFIECITHHNLTSLDFNNTLVIIPLTMISRNNFSLIKNIKTEMDLELNLKAKGERDRISDKAETWLYDYYEAYYYLWSNDKLGVVTTLEAHSAFIKDLFYALVLSIFLNLSNIGCCAIHLSLIIVFVFFPIARYQCEKKIARLIWEGYCYREV